MAQPLPFSPGATAAVSAASGTSGANRQQLTGTGNQVEVQNFGSVTVFVKLGDATVAAATTDYPVGAGQSKVISRNPNSQTNADAITASGTATVYFTVGDGQ